MKLITVKIWPLLALLLYACYPVAAQQQMMADTIPARYAVDTVTVSHLNGPFLVKFKITPKVSTLQQLGVLQSITRVHYILQQLPADSMVVYCYRASHAYKASAALLVQVEKARPQDSVMMQVRCTISDSRLPYASIQHYAAQYSTAVVKVKKQDWPVFISQPAISFADIIRRPATEIIINTSNLTANGINIAQQQFPLIRGQRVAVSVKEDRFDTTDIDLLGRYLSSSYASSQNSSHALIMATLIGGAGNSGDKGLGVAPEVKLSSADFNSSLLPDDNNYYTQGNITVQNHSYGTAIENYYGTEAVAYDQQIHEADTIVHVYSSGNIGIQAATSGRYQGLANYANLSGNFKQAKNVIVAGGTDDALNMMSLSSRGPAYDGRIKPDITAYGQDGTSGAAALTSGVVALLQDAWRQQYNTPLSSALVKAVIINSAQRAAGLLPAYDRGYGNLHALAALQTIRDHRVLQGKAGNQQESTFQITVPEGIQELKVTLCWNDPPAAVNAPQALINDLDLTAVTADRRTWQPWVLNSYPLADSLALPAKRGRDSINNTEQISILQPASGVMQLTVKGMRIPTGTQPFYLAYQFTPVKTFQWQNPAPGTILGAGQTLPLQWQTTYSGNSDIAFSTDSGRSWLPIAQQVPVQQGLYNWPVPELFSKVWLKLTLTDTSFVSAPCYISPTLTIHTGFNCNDSVLLYWNAQPNAVGYQLYTLGNEQLIPYSQTRDTFAFITKSAVKSLYFAVSPVAAAGWTGMRSYALNYSQQGVGCYIETLLADKTTDNKVLLSLTLGSDYHLKKIYWERLSARGWLSLGEQSMGGALNFNYLDNSVTEGLQRYRVKLETTGGQFIYSDPVAVEMLINNNILLFPNPAAAQLYILDKETRSRKMVITDMSGRIVLQRNLEDTQEIVPLQQLANGVYNCSIYLDNKRIFSRQFVKQP
ncbi:S8 family serine peptidase [Chitinophaga polysaccharea]|uniref:S8 family serine peptidase n=1 Tax=Chitinophaga polysaccharea TaxID=1293035 RepID=UPI001455A548|nr:S8 family serine peptidase [Chitinophaga polysaccharea]NLR62186.1 S8 family serine peptidase [Chitinophaga polysaccharea]